MKRRFVTKLLIAVCISALSWAASPWRNRAARLSCTARRVDGGGGSSAGGGFVLNGTAGQADAGTLAGGDFKLYGGFWQPAGDQSLYLPVLVR